MDPARKPRVLLVYYSFSKQALRVTDEMAAEFEARGYEVVRAEIEFTDERYVKRFAAGIPFEHTFRDVFRMLPPQLRRATGDIKIPDVVADGDYDLVCIGSPTWWLTTCMPIRSFLESDSAAKLLDGTKFGAYIVCRRYFGNNEKTVKRLATKNGGECLDAIHYVFAGGQIRSFLAMISYMSTGETREKVIGIKVPPSNLQPGFDEQARTFAGGLVDKL